MQAPTRRRVLQTGAALGVVSACAPPSEDPLDTGLIETGLDDTGLVPDTDPPIDTGPIVDTVDTVDTGDQTPPRRTYPVETFDPTSVLLSEDLFPWAVTAGGMEGEKAMLVTRVSGPAEVRVRVWQEGPRLGTIKLVAEVDATVGEGGSVRVPIDGLEPGYWHSYAFYTLDGGALDRRSRQGRFMQPPWAGSLRPLVLAAQACNGGDTGEDDAAGRLVDHDDVELILHLGDIVYADGARTVPEYRAKWREWMASPGYRQGFPRAGMYCCWDDHEVDNNWNPESTSDAQREAARQVFLESIAVVPGDDGRLWRSWRWGDTAEIFQLDCRSERLPSTAGGGGADDVYISDDQMAWLKAGLRDSTAHFRVVMTSVPITRMPWFGVASEDRWEGFPGQRNELLNWIKDEDIRNVWFIGGDFHINFVSRVNLNGQGRLADTYEVAVTSGNSNPLGEALRPPQFSFGSLEPHIVKMTFDPGADEVTVVFINPSSGNVVKTVTLSQP